MNRLIFQAGAFDQLARLLLHDSRETAAILLASPGRTPAGGWRLVVTEVNPAPPRRTLTELRPLQSSLRSSSPRLSRRPDTLGPVLFSHTRIPGMAP